MRHNKTYLNLIHVISLFTLMILSLNIIVNVAGANSGYETKISSFGTIQVQDEPQSGIFFEYGAEDSSLDSVFDWVGPNGSGSFSGSGAIIDSTHVKSGSYAIKIYQPAPPKSDAQRRVGLKLYGETHSLDEFYFSWWMYFPSGFSAVVAPGSPQWGPVLGGVCNYWGNPSDPSRTSAKGIRFRFILAANMRCWVFFDGMDQTGDNPALGSYHVEGSPSYKDINEEEWVHFQVYWKKGNATTGRCKAWINNVLIFDKACPTDPADWGEPEVGDSYSHDSPHPTILAESYCSQDTLKHEFWVDDIVVSTKKVP